MSILLAWSSIGLTAQTSSLAGKVTSQNGTPLSGAVVVFDQTEFGALTDDDGSYRISGFPSGNYNVIVSIPGMNTLSKTLYIEGEMDYSPKLQPTDPELPQSSQTVTDAILLLRIPEASVYGVGNVPENGVFANSRIERADIVPLDNGQDLPYLLRFTPSLVTTSDAGAGIGYTGLRIRGSDQSRINVTINGIPYNDPESQGVFWVNLPDFAASADNISIQRGVGSSTNGAGAFGGTLGINTTNVSADPFAEISNTVGSFNTFRHRVAFGTGLMDNGFAIEGRLSQITSDGYIDRASSELRSYYLGGSYQTEKIKIEGLVFGGKERTYQAWWGVPQVALNGSSEEEITAWSQNNGYTERQINDLINLGRRANFYTYDNEVDDYTQDHYQLHFTGDLGAGFTLNAAGHYTYGRGFFEQYRVDDDLADYGFDPIVLGVTQQFSNAVDADGNPFNAEFESLYGWDAISFNHTPVLDNAANPITDANGNVLLNSQAQIASSDVVRRRWLENDFYGTTYALNYEKALGNNAVSAVLGGAWNAYDGDHFGEIIWMEHANTVQHTDLYYFNNGFKTDFNNYLKVNYLINGKLSIYGDVQWRRVTYDVHGLDQDRIPMNVLDTLSFINPKFGFALDINPRSQFYGSYSVGNREPARNDYVDAPVGSEPRHETLRDLELGFRHRGENYGVGVNLYNMDYTDQLVLTGAINDVGTPIRTNVANSYRRGVELEAGWNPIKRVSLNANATFSQNKIENFVEEVAEYDAAFNYLGQSLTELGETDIAFSPNLIAAALLSYRFIDTDRHKAEIGWQTKYVSEQFLDNSSSADRVLPAYLVNDLRISYSLLNTGMKALDVNLLVNNILAEDYLNNGYTYAFIFGDTRIDENFFYPSALRNYLVSVTLRF